ncbi:amidophosphoribosyltransferase [Pseudomonas oryzihabitans]|nr:amidophosphoribosyltransferase [Pseudomonas psychrotolerans]KTT02216.1 amidophosphoribosyltransferase [Pseudomonas psychrotolerans]
MSSPLYRYLQRHWQRLRPGTACTLCGAWLPPGLALCEGCESELPWLGSHCQCCALPLPVDGLVCGGCLAEPPAFDQVLAPWRYAFPVDSLINGFKHRDRGSHGRLAGALLARHLQHLFDEGQPRPELLLPVPLSPQRLRQRGFNQAALLAGWLAKPLHLPVNAKLLQRVQEQHSQQGLTAGERRRNLKQAFALLDEAELAGRHVALVDDVLTTGATADSLARLLKRAGVRRVDVYCLARTPPPGE